METINKLNTNLFDRAAYFITSIKAVIMAMACLLVFLLIETSTLFVRQLPEDISLFWRVVASIAIAFAFEFTVLIFTANNDQSRKGLKPQHILASFHFLINTYFWQVVEFTDWIDLGYRLFLSVLFPYLTYQYAALFERKFREKKSDNQSTVDKLIQLVAQYKSANDDLKSANQELNSSQDQLKRRHEELLRTYAAQTKELTEVKRKLSRKRINRKEHGKIFEESG